MMKYIRSLDHVALALHELKEGNSHKAVSNLMAAIAEPDFEKGLELLDDMQQKGIEEKVVDDLNAELSVSESTEDEEKVVDMDDLDDEGNVDDLDG